MNTETKKENTLSLIFSLRLVFKALLLSSVRGEEKEIINMQFIALFTRAIQSNHIPFEIHSVTKKAELGTKLFDSFKKNAKHSNMHFDARCRQSK